MARRWFIRVRVGIIVAACAAGALHTVTPVHAATTLSATRVIPDPPKSGHAYLYGWGATTLLDGSVLIGDYWNYQIRHFAKNGTELPIFYKNRGFGVGQTQAPYGLATDPVDGSVYLADTDRKKIDHFDSNGNFLNQFGSAGSGTGQFQYPSRVTVARDQRVFVADTWANKIVVFNKNGVEQSRFGAFGAANGQFKQPHGMAIWENGTPSNLADDLLLVNDTGNKRVAVFNLNGVWQRNIGGPGSQCVAGQDPQFVGDLRGLAIDQTRGVFYVVDAAGNRIRKIAVGSGKLDATAPCFGTTGTGDAAAPSALGAFTDGGREATVDGDGNLWVGDMPNFRAQKFSPSGQALLQVPSPATADWAPPPGGFNGPRGVAIDADGELFVTDTYNQRVQKLNFDGSFNRQWGSRGRDNYAFNYARMIATNRNDGSVWVADTDNHTIKKFDNNGVWQCQIGSLGVPGSAGGKFRNPHGIDVGPDGRVYVADSRNARVQVLDSNCNFLSMWGTKGTGAGQMEFPRGLAVDTDNSVWVADSGRNLVMHYSNTGALLGTIGSSGAAPNQWRNPFDLAVDCEAVYVVDTRANQIKVWSKSGQFQSAFGGGGKALGKFLKPNGIDIRNGRLYVAEQDNERVQELTTSAACGAPPPPPPPPPPPGGRVLSEVGTIGGPGHADMYPSGVELSSDGSVLVVADTGNNQIEKYTRKSDGSYAKAWGVGAFGGGEGQFNNPRDVGVDAAGAVYVADTVNGRVVKLNGATGAVLATFRGPDGDRLGTPMGLTVANNRLFVADASRRKVRVYTLDGGQERAFTGSGTCALSQLRDVTADAAGNIYVANYTLNNIVKFSPAGACVSAWGTKGTGNGQFANPYGVAIGVSGGTEVIYVADSNNNRVQEFNLAGNFRRAFGGSGDYNVDGTFTALRRVAVGGGLVCGADLWGWRIGCFQGNASSGYSFARRVPAAVSPPAGFPENPFSASKAFNEPRGVSFDNAGNLYVADSAHQRIVRVDGAGVPQVGCGERTESTKSFNWPRGVAVDTATGRTWVADTKQSRLQILQSPFDGCSRYTLGRVGTGVGNFNWPASVAIRSSDKTAWFADSNNNRVTVWDVATRKPIRTFGGPGAGTNQFDDPAGIGITDNGDVLVADTKNNRVVRLTASAGAATISWSGTYAIPGGFNRPEGVDGADGYVYVADTGNDALVVLDASTGKLEQTVTGFRSPANVAVDNNGRVVVSDTYNDRLRVLAWSGSEPEPPAGGLPRYDGEFAGPGLASMYPVDITESGSDLFVVDPGRYRIVRVHVDGAGASIVDTFGGKRGRAAGELGAARAIAHDAAGRLYIADTPNNRVVVLGTSPTMHFVANLTGFAQPYGVAVGEGVDARGEPAEVLYVTDQEARVQALSLSGTVLREFGRGELNQPRQLAVNRVTKDVYVLSARAREVVVYSPTGTRKFAFGKGGTKPGEFSGDPRGVTITSDGSTVLVTDSLGRRIQAFDAANGSLKFAFGSQGAGDKQFTDPRGLTVTDAGTVFVTDEWDYSLKRFQLNATNTGITAEYRRFFGVPAPVGGFNSPRGLAVDASGRVFAVDWWNNRVQRIGSGGSQPMAWGARGTPDVPGSINFAWDLALEPGTGRVFLANRESNEIEVFTAAGEYVTRWGSLGAGDGQLHFPQGVAFLPDGKLVVADSANDRLQVFAIDGAGRGSWVASYGGAGNTVGKFDTPTGVATAPDGSIWVADTRNNRVQRRAPDGTWSAFATVGDNALKLPWGVTVAPDGRVWVADSGHGEIVVMGADGTLAFAFKGSDIGTSPFDSPFKVAFGPGGRVYVADTWNNRIVQLAVA